MPIAYRRLTRLDDPRWEALLELYKQSFPPDERDPIGWLEGEVLGTSRLQTHFWVAESEDDLVGFVRFCYLPGAECTWVIHLAVTPDWRSLGVGRELLRLAEGKGPILIEVDRVEDATSENELEIREKRLEWFRRAGAKMLTRTYTQPALGSEGHPVPLYLLIIGEPGEDLIERFYEEAWQISKDHEYFLEAYSSPGSMP